MQPATLVGLSRRQGVIETSGALPPYVNIVLRWSPPEQDHEVLELYAKVIRNVDGAENRYLVHFTSIPPKARIRLHQLLHTAGSS